MSKPALTSSLIAVKGQGKAIENMPTRSPVIQPLETAPEAPTVAAVLPKAEPADEPNVHLNFSVPKSFRKRFNRAADDEDKSGKLFLMWLFAEYEKRQKQAGD